MKKIIYGLLSAGLIAVFLISWYNVLQIQSRYEAEASIHEEVMAFKPEVPEKWDSRDHSLVMTKKIPGLQKKYKDAIGWITIPGAGIDHPFVQSSDNDFYLRRDIRGKTAYAGTVFMDYRNNKDFSDCNTILYGHHMKNGSMFGSLKKFSDKSFFKANRTGTIILADKVYTLDLFAYMVVQSNDGMIYNKTADDPLIYMDAIKEKARQYRDVEFTQEDRIVTLSTCAYEFNGARMVLMGRIGENHG